MSEEKNKPETGNTNLALGAGIGVYGTVAFLATGVVCPICVIVPPALLGYGAYQRYKHNKSKDRAPLEEAPSQDRVLPEG